MTSRVTQDTYSLRIRELIALNPATQDEIQPGSIPVIGQQGKLGWYSSLEFLSSISIPTTSTNVLAILEAIQPGLSTLSTTIGSNTSTTTSTFSGQLLSSVSGFQVVASSFGTLLQSTVDGLGTAGYKSSLELNVSTFTTESLILRETIFSSIVTTLYKGNTVDYGKGIWVAGGQMDAGATLSNGCLQWSSNARLWTAISTPFTRVNKVLFTSTSSERWYATGYTDGTSNSTILISEDGRNWSNTSAQSLIEGKGIAVGKFYDVGLAQEYWQIVVTGRTLAGTTAATIQATNDDGNTWNANDSLTLTTVNDVTYTSDINGLFHFVGTTAAGTSNNTYVSGITTLSPYSGFLTQQNTPLDAVYSIASDPSGNLYAIGHEPINDQIFTASNIAGASFALGEQILANGSENRIKYLSSLWIAAGKGALKSSDTGALGSWTTRTTYFDTARDIAYNGSNQWVAVGKAITPPSTIIKGSTLSALSDTTLSFLSSVLKTSTTNLLINGNPAVTLQKLVSTVKGLGTTGYISTIIDNPNPTFSTVNSFAYILNEVFPSTLTIPFLNHIFTVAYGNGTWLVGGSTITGTSPFTVAKSTDNGKSWSFKNFSNTCTKILYEGADTFYFGNVSGGATNFYTTSDAGETITGPYLTGMNSIFDMDKNTDASLIGVTGSGVSTLYIGTIFAGESKAPSNFTEGHAISYNSTLNTWIAGGIGSNSGSNYTSTGNLQVSTDDGSNWTELSCPITGIYGLATNPSSNRWVAIGDRDNTSTFTDLAVSTDSGSTWTVTSNIFPNCDPRYTKVRFLSNRFFIFGNALSAPGTVVQTIKTSTDGSSWTSVSSNFLIARDIDTNGSIYMAGGQEWNAMPDSNDSYSSIVVSQFSYSTFSNTIPYTVSTMISTTFGTVYINGEAVLTQSTLTSSIVGLGTLGYVSTNQLNSTVDGLGTAGYLSTQISSFSTVFTKGLTFFDSNDSTKSTLITLSGTTLLLNTVSTILTSYDITSTVNGLGTAGYLSTNQIQTPLASTVDGLGESGYLSSISYLAPLTSTVDGLGSSGYLSSISYLAPLTSTVDGLGSSGYLSTTAYLTPLTSSIIGLGTSEYVSSTQLTSTVEGLGTLDYVSSLGLLSTVGGLGTSGYVSTTNIGTYGIFQQVVPVNQFGTGVTDSNGSLTGPSISIIPTLYPRINGNSPVIFDVNMTLNIAFSNAAAGGQITGFLTNASLTSVAPSNVISYPAGISSFTLGNMRFVTDGTQLANQTPLYFYANGLYGSDPYFTFTYAISEVIMTVNNTGF